MIILHNAKIYTLDPITPVVSAIAIRDHLVLAIGTDEDILSLAESDTRLIDLHGKTIWPGLTDAHQHLQNFALSLQWIDCETTTKEECIKRVAKKTATAKPDTWIRGHGWNQNVWNDGFGNAADLDHASNDHPVYLTAKSLHASWANSAALRLAGIDSRTPDPEGGRIQRDASGKPTGILFESAMALVEEIIPAPTVTEVREAILEAQPVLWKMGITGLHDFDRRTCFLALQQLNYEDQLRLRIVKSVPLENLPQAVELGLSSGFGNDFLRIGSVKLFADGALGPQTAAMLQPYEGSDQETGLLFLDSEQVFEYGLQASQSGLSLAIHAIGDRANHEMLQGYEYLRRYEAEHNLRPLRHRIEHVQILHPDDLARLAELDIIASVQPIHATSDMLIADQFWGERAANAYAFQALLENGTRLAFGSDAPVESPNPFWGIHAAVTRRRQNGTPDEAGWYSQQRITLQQALEAYTITPAYCAGVENHLGRLSPGYLADLIVLPQDPFTMPAQEIFNIQPDATMVNGTWVWQRE